MATTLQILQDTLQNQSSTEKINSAVEKTEHFNWWSLLAIIELVIILTLIYKNQKIKNKVNIKEEFGNIKKGSSSDMDMDNLVKSMHGSRELYKKLSRKCHPDRFQDEMLKDKADKIFQDISRYKRNHAKLTQLQKQAEKELDIKF